MAEFNEAQVQRVRSLIQDTDLPDLIETAREMRRQAETYRRCAAACEDALYQRRGEATVLDGTDSVAEMSQAQTYEWDGDRFKHAMLRAGFDAETLGFIEYVAPSAPTYKVDTRKALAFAKKRAIDISPYYTIKPTAPRWEYSDKAKKEETS